MKEDLMPYLIKKAQPVSIEEVMERYETGEPANILPGLQDWSSDPAFKGEVLHNLELIYEDAQNGIYTEEIEEALRLNYEKNLQGRWKGLTGEEGFETWKQEYHPIVLEYIDNEIRKLKE